MLQELGLSLSLEEFDFCGHLLSCSPPRVNLADVTEAAGRGAAMVPQITSENGSLVKPSRCLGHLPEASWDGRGSGDEVGIYFSSWLYRPGAPVRKRAH